MRIMSRLVLSLFVLAAIAVFLTINSNLLLQNLISNYLSSHTSFQVDIGDADLRLFDGTISLKDIKITNPPQYEPSTFAEIDLLKVSVNVSSLWKKRIEFEEIALSVSSIHAVREKNHNINITDFIKEIQNAFKSKKKSSSRTWIARRCLVGIKSFSVTDYSQQPTYQNEYTYGYKKVFTDLTSYEDLVEGVSKAFQGEVANYIIEEFLHSLLDDQTYRRLFKKIFSPIKILLNNEENPKAFEFPIPE